MIREIIGRKMEAERKRADLSLEEVAGKIGLSRQTLSLVEKGQKVIDSEKLLKFARLVGRSISYFFEEKTPEVQLFFRADSAQRITPALEASLVGRYHHYVELEETLGLEQLAQLPPSISIESFSGNKQEFIEGVAREERKRLGAGEEPIKNPFEFLENNGIKVVVLPLGDRDLFGATCYKEKSGPCIFVNADDGIPAVRRIFTLVHEYGHLIFHRREFVDLNTFRYRKGIGKGKASEEKVADSFAGAFLVPEERLKKVAPRGYRITPADIMYIKQIFNVSFKTVVKRLHQCGVISSRQNTIFHKWLNSKGFSKTEPEPTIAPEQLQVNKRLDNLLRKAYETISSP